MLLFSQTSATLQVVNHLPAEPAITKTLSLPSDATPNITVSDDGELIALARTDGTVLLSSAEKWTTLPTAFTANALAFIAKTHDLALSDTAQKTILIFPDATKNYRVVAQDIQADYLATTRGGEQLIAANRSQGHIWTIDLKTLQVSQKDVMTNLQGLSALRDGYTFLLSNSEGLALMSLTGAIR
jgi:sugar lactone lactonase YvrE